VPILPRMPWRGGGGLPMRPCSFMLPFSPFSPNCIFNYLPMVQQQTGISRVCAFQHFSLHPFGGGGYGGLIYSTYIYSTSGYTGSWAIFPAPECVHLPGVCACVDPFWGVPPDPLRLQFYINGCEEECKHFTSLLSILYCLFHPSCTF
jgi:hypothetical protein